MSKLLIKIFLLLFLFIHYNCKNYNAFIDAPDTLTIENKEEKTLTFDVSYKCEGNDLCSFKTLSFTGEVSLTVPAKQTRTAKLNGKYSGKCPSTGEPMFSPNGYYRNVGDCKIKSVSAK